MRSTSTPIDDPEEFEKLKRQCVDHIENAFQELGVEETGELSGSMIQTKIKKPELAVLFQDTLCLLEGLTCMVTGGSYAPRGVTMELLEAQKIRRRSSHFNQSCWSASKRNWTPSRLLFNLPCVSL